MKVFFLLTDVDGTLTDGKIYTGVKGELMKAFDVKDGFAIHEMLPKAGIIPIVITGRSSVIVQNRCKELGICEIHQNVQNKLSCMREIINRFSTNSGDSYSLSACAYIGDDIPDLECMLAIREQGGLTGCPADAVREIREVSDFVSSKNGGCGAVREFIEWVIAKQHSARS